MELQLSHLADQSNLCYAQGCDNQALLYEIREMVGSRHLKEQDLHRGAADLSELQEAAAREKATCRERFLLEQLINPCMHMTHWRGDSWTFALADSSISVGVSGRCHCVDFRHQE